MQPICLHTHTINPVVSPWRSCPKIPATEADHHQLPASATKSISPGLTWSRGHTSHHLLYVPSLLQRLAIKASLYAMVSQEVVQPDLSAPASLLQRLTSISKQGVSMMGWPGQEVITFHASQYYWPHVSQSPCYRGWPLSITDISSRHHLNTCCGQARGQSIPGGLAWPFRPRSIPVTVADPASGPAPSPHLAWPSQPHCFRGWI